MGKSRHNKKAIRTKHRNKGKKPLPKIDRCPQSKKLMLTEEKADMYIVLYHYKLRKYKCPHCHMWHTTSKWTGVRK